MRAPLAPRAWPHRAHLQLDAHLRRLYKHADGYLRKMNELCEASRLLSDDFAEVRAAVPARLLLVPTDRCTRVPARLRTPPLGCHL